MGSSETKSWHSVATRLHPVLHWVQDSYPSGEEIVTRDALIARDVLPYLLQLITLEQPGGARLVTRRDLSTWGVSAGEVFDAAYGNLAQMARATFQQPHAAAETSALSGHEAVTSLPIIDGWLHDIHAMTGSRAVVFLPGHDHMTIAVGPGPVVLGALVRLMGLAFEESEHPLSPVPYALDDSGVLGPLVVPPEHPAWHAIGHARNRLAVSVYARQTRTLQARHKEYLPSLVQIQPPSGPGYTLTTWTNGIPALLPHADVISFVDFRSDAVLQVKWSDVAASVKLTPAAGFEPPRFRVESHPPTQIMTRLHTCAIPHD